MRQPPDHAVARRPFAAPAPLVQLEDPARQHRPIRFESLPGDDEAGLSEFRCKWPDTPARLSWQEGSMMTETLPNMSASVKAAEAPQKESHNHDEGQLPEAFARPSAEELEVARELVRSARERGTALTGPGGLLKALTKTVIETALDEEMADHLGYDKHDPAGQNTGNSRNGTRTKTVLTDNCGPVEIEVPRDRVGSFDPAIVKKWQRRSGDVDTIVLSLYAKGLTTGEISAHFAEIYGASVSKDTISRITDKVIAEMAEWMARPLEKVYAAVFIDAIHIKVRDGQVGNRPVYAAIGVDLAGHKDVLGLWAGTGGGETAKFWMSVLAELKNRGVADVFFVVCDGLKGLPDSCYASDLVRHPRREKPSQGSVCLSDWEVVEGVESERVEEPEEAAVVAAEREVRVVGLGALGSGHPARGRGEVPGRPVHGHAGVQDRQAGCSGRAGGSQTRTAWPVPGGGRVGRCARGDRAASRDGDRTGGGAASVSGKIALGLTTGPVPVRVDAHVKAGLLDLVDHALEAGWSRRRACRLLDLDEDRTADWLRRRRDHGLDGLVDAAPGGGAVHGLLDAEIEAILALFETWGEVDRSHRKLAHRGSRLDLVHVSESTVRRVLAGHGMVLRGPAPREPAAKTPWPDWLEWKPQRIWAYDFTHFTRAKRAVIAVLDMVSRKWIATLCSPEETSTQVETCFLAGLEAEGLLDLVDQRATTALRKALLTGDHEKIQTVINDGELPMLLAVSDNGPQMRSHTTREFLAGVHIAQHFGRPHTPTDQAWIETLFGHVKGEWPHLEKITDPGVLDAELDRVRTEYNTVRLHAAIGYVTPDDEHEGRGEAIRERRRNGLEMARHKRIDYRRSQARKQP